MMRFVEEIRPSEKIVFASNREVTGIDNFYVGNFNSMFNLIYNFHYNLDDILKRHIVSHQEFLVFRESERFNIFIRNT